MALLMVSIICAMANNRAIGLNGKMLWHIPDELAYFKQTTLGCSVIMGNKTFQSLNTPLKGRQNIVLSRSHRENTKDIVYSNSLIEAIRYASDSSEREIFIIGGGEVYEQALPLANKIYLTTILKDYPEADTFFPEFNQSEWMQYFCFPMRVDGYSLVFRKYEKIV